MKDVKAEVRRLNQRLDGAEAVNRLIFKVQMGSLAKAEQLRKLALDAVKAPPGRLRAAMTRLRWYVQDLPEFHKHPTMPRGRRRARPTSKRRSK